MNGRFIPNDYKPGLGGFLDPMVKAPGPNIGPNLGPGIELQALRNIQPSTGPLMNPGLGMGPSMMANKMKLGGMGGLSPMPPKPMINSLQPTNMRAGGTGLGARPGQSKRARRTRGAGIGMY